MAIQYLEGDFITNPERAKALAYNCNCEGEMNTTFAVQFRNRYPQMYEEYRRLCEANEFRPGDVFLWQARDGMWVFNVATQDDKFLKLAGRRKLERAFTEMRKQAEENDINSIAMPPLGAGIGGLYWGKTRRLIERAFKGWKGTLYVYVKIPGRPPNAK